MTGRSGHSCFDRLGELRAGHARHGVIGNHQIHPALVPQRVEGLLPGGSFDNDVAKVFEHRDDVHPDKHVVIDDQHP